MADLTAVKSLLISGIYFPPQVGGISHFMAAIASTLGPDQVCCLTGVSAGPNLVSEERSRKIYRRPRVFAKSKAIQAMAGGAAITEILVREHPQVVQLATVSEGYLGLWMRRWFGLPFVIYAHGNEILEVLDSTWPKSRLALQQANRVIAVSRFTADCARKAGVLEDRIEIVHPGCDVNYFRPLDPRMDLRQRLLGARSDDRVILTVGNLVPRKGHDVVIRALPRLLSFGLKATYLIVGDGPHRTALEKLAQEAGVRSRVIFAGRLAFEDLPHVYALSDVFVMPCRQQLELHDVEGFGLVFLEANACGKPVVGGRSGGVGDAIVDGVTGLFVDPDDPEDVANAIRRILTDAEFAKRLGQQGRLRTVNEFSWTRVGDRLRDILASVEREKQIRRTVSGHGLK